MHTTSNKLFRWKVIAEEYVKHTGSGLPTTQIYHRFIYPKFFISLRTLNTILGTSIDKELKSLGYSQEDINRFVSRHNRVDYAHERAEISNVIGDNPYMQPNRHNQIF